MVVMDYEEDEPASPPASVTSEGSINHSSESSAVIDKENFLGALLRLPEKPGATIRFFDRGESYAVYGSDAEIAAETLTNMTAGIRKLRSPTSGSVMDYFNVSRNNFDPFVRELLLVKQYKVEVWINQRNKWILEYKGSPGNLSQFEDILVSSDSACNSGVLGVRFGNVDKNKVVGVSYVNLSECVIHLMEFVDNDSLTNFESALVQLAPKEIVMSTQIDESIAIVLLKILERSGVIINSRKHSDFDSKDIHQDLGRLLKAKASELQNVAANPELAKTLAVSSLAGVIKYLELTNSEMYFNQFSLKPFDYGLYVKMDSAACEALHLTQNPLESQSRGALTLTSVLDQCRTPQGRRLLNQFLRQPLIDKEKLEERYDLVEILMEDMMLKENLHEEHLRRVPDCQMISRKLGTKRASLQDCYKSYLSVVKLPKLIEDLEAHCGPKARVLSSYFIEPIKALHEDFSKFVEMIESTLDLDLASQSEFMIRPEFDEILKELRDQMDVLKERMMDELRNVAETVEVDAKLIKLETSSKDGYHFRVTLKDERSIRGNRSLLILDSNKSGLRFRTSKLDSINALYANKLKAYEATQKSYIEDVIEVASGYHSSFEQFGHILAALDVFTSFAIVASSASTQFVRPILHPAGTGILKFEELRHPCVEAQTGITFIPNSISFEKGKESFFILTGPNMGGKSTFLRSIGVASLMAQIGSFVPAKRAEISIVDAILARIGAGDCLIKGVSTFMAEMIETSFILKTATSNSLVLVDELGRGTSTYDGFGLCWAISQRLATAIDSFTVLATHFHELTALADEVKTVSNIHVTALADETGLSMLYRIERGACDKSFGLHVAEVTDFPPKVIKSARVKVNELEDYSGDGQEDDSEEAVAERRREKKEGQKAIHAFELKLKELANSSMTEEDFQETATKLHQELTNSGNPYINRVLASLNDSDSDD